jgi:hypothetical protein
MDLWKTIDLTQYEPVPVENLESGHKYIMCSTTDNWYMSRWLIKFNKHHGDNVNSRYIFIDVLDVKFHSSVPNIEKNYLGKNQLFGTEIWVYYDYDNIDKLKPVLEEMSHRVPTLDSLARSVASQHHGIDYDTLKEEVPIMSRGHSVRQSSKILRSQSTGNLHSQSRGGKNKRSSKKASKNQRKTRKNKTHKIILKK